VPLGPTTRSIRLRFALVLTLPILLAVPDRVTAQDTREVSVDEEFVPVDEFVGPDGLTGDAIYERVLENRFDAFEQIVSLRSGAASGGGFQTVRVRLRYRNFRHDASPVLSKTIAKYLEPTDVRHLGYLVINKRSGQDDQFVYRPSARKVRRVNVRGESIAGTDFSFEDIVPPEFEDGTHHRMPDEVLDGRSVYVVTVVPKPETESEYSKLVLSIDRDHAVPIRTLYWDNKRVLVKQLDVDPASITSYEARYDGEPKVIHLATRSRMKHLKLETYTELVVDEFDARPELRDRHFSERELTASR
jgi:hypothetical protein